MTFSELAKKMIDCTEINPVLSIQEISDFILCELPENPAVAIHKGIKNIEEKQKQWWKVDYTTKKRINEEIKKTNTELEEWMVRKRKRKDILVDVYIEDCLEKKKQLKARLASLGKFKHSDEKERARAVPITMFLDFNSAGFARCLWHDERTGSLHLLPSKNAAWCFSCGTRYDSIAAVMKLHGVDFSKAVKIILNQ